jgi:hypothetical protein
MPYSKRCARLPRVVPLAAYAALIVGCGCSGSSGPPDSPDPPARVFTSLTVTPASAGICTIAPGNTVSVTVSALDQSGQIMTGLGNASFTSSSQSVATVDATGLVTALLQGTTQITASLTANAITRTASSAITVASALTSSVTGSVSDNHPLAHAAVITAAQLTAGGAHSLSIRNDAMHSHALALTSAQMIRIAAGCKVTQASSQDTHSDGTGIHAHNVTFN